MGRFEGRIDASDVDVSVYGRDASDAQLLAKTARFLFYRDSGPTLTFTRRQQVEHEAYLTLMAGRAGANVPVVLAAGPAGPEIRREAATSWTEADKWVEALRSEVRSEGRP